MTAQTKALITAYYDAFNRGDTDAMEAMLHEDFEHHVNEGGVRRGRDGFSDFNRHMSETYRESLTDMVIMASDDGTRGAAEFIVNGSYLKTDPGLPEARGQTYRLPAGAFFAVSENRIARVTTYYNLSEWIRQVS